MMQFVAAAAGILLGIFSGLLPGIHSNTIASVLAPLPIPPEAFQYLVVAALGAHMAFQFFPSIFLSIPDDTVVASVLPGHRMALAGRGREAISVCAICLLLAAGASAALLPLALLLIPLAYSFVQPNTAPLLILASLYLIATEKAGRKIALATFVFILAGALGLVSLNVAIPDALFPAFSGLFAASGILLSFTSHQKLPKQEGEETKLDFLPMVALGIVLGMLSDLLPGIAAPAQIAVFASAFVFIGDDARKFLALVSSIAASHAVFAFASLVSIGKAREGALAIANEMRQIMPGDLPALVGVFIFSMGVSCALLVLLAKKAGSLAKFDLGKINLAILAYLTLAVAIISGAGGLLLFATATAIGMLPPLLGIRRTHVMGLIIVPSIMLAV